MNYTTFAFPMTRVIDRVCFAQSSSCFPQAHLSEVYRNRSGINNSVPRTVVEPPPWANLDLGLTSSAREKRLREAQWDDRFAHGQDAQEGAAASRSRSRPQTSARRRPASAGSARRQHERSSDARATHSSLTPVRMQSAANLRERSKQHRGHNVAAEGHESLDVLRSSDKTDKRKATGKHDQDQAGGLSYFPTGTVRGGDASPSAGEDNILDREYRLNAIQQATFRAFVEMLTTFDTYSMIHVVDDAFREAQRATGLQDFTGCGDE